MRDFANPCSVLTKSPLLLRDLELMKEIAERTEFTANLSIPTLDEKAWRATEPHTPHPRKRIEAVAELKRAGIRTGVLIAPLIPGVNDSPEQVEPLLELLDEAGAGLDRRRRAAPARRGARDLVRLAARAPAGPAPALRGAVRARGLHASARRRAGSARWSGAAERPRAASRRRPSSRRRAAGSAPRTDGRRVSPPPGRQPRLF